MNSVAFRVDGGSEIGLGHIARCLTLANELRNEKYNVFFISSMDEGIAQIHAQGFSVFKINNELEIPEMVRLLKYRHADILFVDKYNVAEQYFFELKPLATKLGYIDDLNAYVYPVNMLIHGSIVGDFKAYRKYSDDEIILSGLKYNLIRNEFLNLPKRILNYDVNNIMICTGGADKYNMTAKLAHILLSDNEFQRILIHLIIANGFTSKEELKSLKIKHDNVMLHENVANMSGVMQTSDVAISAGGGMLYELCACGTPTIAFTTSENQEFIVNKMHESGFIINIGSYNQITPDNLLRTIKSLIHDYNTRNRLCVIGQQIIDGMGAKRIVSAIKSWNI